MIKFLKFFFNTLTGIFTNIYRTFRYNRIARILLIIVIIKFSILYGFLKSYLYPRYLKPKWESKQERIDAVTDDLIKQHKLQNHD